MCAALKARSDGLSVAILEKTDFLGGTTALSGGVMWIPNNRFMKEEGIADSFEEASAYLDSVVGNHTDAPGASKERRSVYLREAPLMVDFLVDQGIQLTRVSYYPDYYDERPGGSKRGRSVVAKLFDKNELGEWRDRLRPGMLKIPAALEEAMQLPTFKQSWAARWLIVRVGFRAIIARLTGKQWVTAGEALQGRMLQASLREGVTLRTGSPADDLIVSNDAVVGVVTRKGGQEWRIGARYGVLVNAGGFARNQRMRDKYLPGTKVEWTSAAPGDTGEMIEIMMRHGAAVAQMDEMVGNQLALPPGGEKADVRAGVQKLTAGPHAILVDQNGKRYMNEGGSYMAYCKSMRERPERVPSWAIFDSQAISKYMIANTMPGRKKPASWTDTDFLRASPSLEGLAKLISTDPATLRYTVDRFNNFVDLNRDQDFDRGERAYDKWLGDPHHQPSTSLGKIEKTPFYAIEIFPGDVGTFGGVVTDVKARVLRNDGTPIAGLYATGASTASVMGRAYPGAGSSIGPSFVWGYVAACNATTQRIF